MTARTTETNVTFRQPFHLSCFDDAQAAGTYLLVVEEEEILGLSFVVFRRISTMLHTPALSATSGSRQVFLVDPAELETAMAADASPRSLLS